ncbi:hypothetical protein BpHYR1_042743 [Brachionus plicatilis]|uniref:Uncharacterized protein n=1 Tax=Brachionus plicatilis TaxID=10195 RepID=A0A3M7SB06_BRAPC|nr:hypothetical protein BpHYR1_042743 [Brachionus plicatilis]
MQNISASFFCYYEELLEFGHQFCCFCKKDHKMSDRSVVSINGRNLRITEQMLLKKRLRISYSFQNNDRDCF